MLAPFDSSQWQHSQSGPCIGYGPWIFRSEASIKTLVARFVAFDKRKSPGLARKVTKWFAPEQCTYHCISFFFPPFLFSDSFFRLQRDNSSSFFSAHTSYGKFPNCDQKCVVSSIPFCEVHGQVEAEGRWGGVLQGGSAAAPAVSCHCKLRVVVVAVVYILAALGGPLCRRGAKQLPGLPVPAFMHSPWHVIGKSAERKKEAVVTVNRQQQASRWAFVTF